MEQKTKDQQFIDWESDTFGYGYGTGEPHVIHGLKLFFESLDDGSYDYKKLEEKLGSLAAWLFINILCRADILEYGTSPRFGWLTPKGRKLQEYFAVKSEDELYELISVDADYVHCGRRYCNCADGDGNSKCKHNEFF